MIAAPDSSIAVSIEHLSHTFGDLPVLQDISVQARRGAMTVIIGPNASGKSTFLRCIVGALRPSSGTVRINDLPVHHTKHRILARHLAYVPQRPVVSAAFTVRQVIALGRFALSSNGDRVDQAIAALDLEDVVDRLFPELSAGQQQRVTLARAHAQIQDGGCLVLDEPTSAMDLLHIQQTADLLVNLRSRGTTIIMALHDFALAADLADDVWLLNEGRLVSNGSAAEVLNTTVLERVFHVPFDTWTDSRSRQRLAPILNAVSR